MHAGLNALADRVATGQRRVGGPVFRVARAALPELDRRVEALNRRASRLGCSPIGVSTTTDALDDVYVHVVVIGEAPVLAGWVLAAIVEHHASGAVVRAVDRFGARLDAGGVAVARCDHCQLARRRTTTYVVRHVASGERRQVGSGCLRDFLAGHDPARMCAHAEQLTLAHAALERAARSAAVRTRPGQERGQDDPATVPLELFALHAAHVIRAHGFRSRQRARHDDDLATVDAAAVSMAANGSRPDDGDRAVAERALRWARALPALKAELTGFEREASRAAGRKRLGRREQGLVCALIAAYRRQRARSRHLGTPGGTLEVTVLVESITAQPSARFAQLQRCDLLDADANRLVWWQSTLSGLRPGHVLTLRGRVRRHTRFGAGAVTVLTRCRHIPGSKENPGA